MKKTILKLATFLILLSGIIFFDGKSEASVMNCFDGLFAAQTACDQTYSSDHDVQAYSTCVNNASAAICSAEPDFCDAARLRVQECNALYPPGGEDLTAGFSCRSAGGIDYCQ